MIDQDAIDGVKSESTVRMSGLIGKQGVEQVVEHLFAFFDFVIKGVVVVICFQVINSL